MTQQFPPTLLCSYFFTTELTECTELIACVQLRTSDSARPGPAYAALAGAVRSAFSVVINKVYENFYQAYSMELTGGNYWV
jgi:hypothetical protein